MHVHTDLTRLPHFEKAVLTIGAFDGVHLGHQKIIAALMQQAVAIDGESVIITFHPHPRKIVSHAPLQLINTLPEKIELLSQTGVDHLVVVPFTPSFAVLTAEEYIHHFLVEKFHPHTIIIGYDHRFGKNRKGNFALLQQKSRELQYQLMEIPKQVLNEVAVSSTKIRQALLNSDVETANQLLGYDFFFSGLVVTGDQLGRSLGYPTANLRYTDPDKIHLGHGVYAVWVRIDDQWCKGMLSIGNRPTLNDSTDRVEVNIFDFNEMIYDHELRVRVKKFLRRQEKFITFDELIHQMAMDKQNALAVL